MNDRPKSPSEATARGENPPGANLEAEIERRRRGYYDGPDGAFAWRSQGEPASAQNSDPNSSRTNIAPARSVPAILLFMCVALLVMAALPMPYRFYALVRLVACVTFAWAVFASVSRGNFGMAISCGFLALLFNPVFAIHLPKIAWSAVDVASALLLLLNHKRLT